MELLNIISLITIRVVMNFRDPLFIHVPLLAIRACDLKGGSVENVVIGSHCFVGDLVV